MQVLDRNTNFVATLNDVSNVTILHSIFDGLFYRTLDTVKKFLAVRRTFAFTVQTAIDNIVSHVKLQLIEVMRIALTEYALPKDNRIA